jgi:AAHS family 4-hydroxybenzoate transporter-like MFS transporter
VTPTRILIVRNFINQQKVSGFQIRTLFLCFFILVLDGYDTVVVGYAAPALKAHLGATPAQLGPMFGAGLAGLTVGSFLFGPVADRFGRKPTLIGSVFLFGIFSIASAWAGSIYALTVLRFLTGMGLGGAMPNAYTLAAEYCPDRLRSTLVAPIGCGIAAGGALGGLVAPHLIGTYGWQSMFLLGGLLPLALTIALAARLPESIRYLVARGRHLDARAILQQIAPRSVSDDAQLTLAEAPPTRFPFSDLLRPGLRGGTALLWVTAFMTLLVIYFLGNWLPLLIQSTGVPFTQASLMTALYLTGNGTGAILLGFLMDRFNPQYVLAGAFLCAAASLISFGHLASAPAIALAALFITGIGTGGTMTGTNILSAGFYPTATRATGVAWTLGMGRVGSIVGSMIGAAMFAERWTPAVMLAVISAPVIVAALSVSALAVYRRHYPTPGVEP